MTKAGGAAPAQTKRAGALPPRPLSPQTSRALSRSQLARIHLQARPHRRAQRNLLHILALRPGRLGAHDRVHERIEIALQILGGEARLADAGVDDPGLLDPELYLA